MSLDPYPGPIIIAPHFRPRPHLSHALLVWDGTISLLRGGWVDLMVDLCIEHAPGVPREVIHAEMLALNGKPSIHQMTRMAELARTGTADDYQRCYVERLTSVVSERVTALRAGGSVDALLVPGVQAFLGELASRGLELTVASGTALPDVLDEASLLGVSESFAGRIYGPRDTTDREFSKRATMYSLIVDHGIDGEHFVAIGDGPIEIAEAKAMGALAVAVASDEAAPGSRRFDEFKKRQLLDCGADLVVPDFLDAVALVKLMFGERRSP